MTTETIQDQAYPWNTPSAAAGDQVTPGPRLASDVYVYPETAVGMYDYGSGAGLVIGFMHESRLVVTLGYDTETRRDACRRLIEALEHIRDFEPSEPE